MLHHSTEHISRTLDRIALHLVEAFRDEHPVETVLQAVNRAYREIIERSAKTEHVAALIELHAREHLADLAERAQGLACA